MLLELGLEGAELALQFLEPLQIRHRQANRIGLPASDDSLLHPTVTAAAVRTAMAPATNPRVDIDSPSSRADTGVYMST